METQVNVSGEGGEKVPGKGHTFEDAEGNRWWNIRIPRDAASDPHWEDYELAWPLDRHVQAIGMTGWDWENKVSKFVGFDFDAITNHAPGVGVTPEQLEEIKQAAQGLDYVECRLSTSGTGLHFYVLLDDIPTQTHTEHAALARAVLGMMGTHANFDFAAQIDVCGHVMWQWHTKSFGTEGFTLVKQSDKTLALEDLPLNWRDHAEVVSHKRGKVRIRNLENESEFQKVSAAKQNVPLDETHKRIIDFLSETGYVTVWHPDYHCLHTHTGALAELAQRPDIRGVFQTISPATDKAQANCFMFPTLNGGWQVYRFGSPAEAPTWRQDEHYTSCPFNMPATLETAAAAHNGAEKSDHGGGWVFQTGDDAARALAAVGRDAAIPPALAGRETHINARKDKLALWVKRFKDEESPGPPWVEKRGGWWERIVQGVKEEQAEIESDDLLRVLVTPEGQHAGTYVRSSGGWDCHPPGICKMYLQSQGHAKAEAEQVIGRAVAERWQLVNLPFEPEFPGNRRWNRGAAQFRHQPLARHQSPAHPHWDSLIDNLFGSLTEPLRTLDWAQQVNMSQGGDYGRAWLASLIRHPHEPLSYLYMWSHPHEQNICGKSLFWEAIHITLLRNAVIKGEKALAEFNGELEHAVLVALDDFDASDKRLYDKLKDLSTSLMVPIRRMRMDTFFIRNKLHWVQSANGLHKMPRVVDGDARITSCYVPPVPAERRIPKDALLKLLEDEAPAFLRTLLDLELPERQDRLRIPVVDTVDKKHIQTLNQSAIERFIQYKCFHVPGAVADFSDVWQAFLEFMQDDTDERARWSKGRFGRQLPHHFPVGKHTGNKTRIGNLSLTALESPGAPFSLVDGRLKQDG